MAASGRAFPRTSLARGFAMKIWTVGHSSRSWDEFLALLQSHAIELVADVRRFAGSRKHPQFGRDQFELSLRAVGIHYVAIDALGGRRKPRPDSPNTIWRNPSFRGYADYMATPEYRAGRDQLIQLAKKQRVTMLCSEAVWWRCHRSMIADDLKASGICVLHIMAENKSVEHPFTAPASIQGGRLVYGSG